MTPVRILVITLASLLAIAVAALLVLRLAPTTYSPLLTHIVKSRTGFDTTLGDIELELFPPRLGASLVLRTPESNSPALRIEHLELWLEPMQWMHNRAWWGLAASGIDMRLRRWADGSLQFTPNSTQQAPSSQSSALSGPLLAFDRISVADLTLTVTGTGPPERFTAKRIVLSKQPDERLAVDIDAAYRNSPLTASGTLALPSSGGARAVSFRASILGNPVQLSGVVGSDGITPGRAKFDLHVARGTAELSALLRHDVSLLMPLKLSGVLAAPAPGKWTLQAEGRLAKRQLGVDAELSVNGGRYTFHKVALSYRDASRGNAAESAINGSGEFDTDAKKLTATLSSPRIDLDALAQRSDKMPPAPDPENAGTTAPVATPAASMPDTNLLSKWVINLDLQVDRLLYHGTVLRGVTGRIHGASGAFQLRAGINALSRWPSAAPLKLSGRGRVSAKSIELDPITIEAADNRLDGKLTIATSAAQPQLRGTLQGDIDLNNVATSGALGKSRQAETSQTSRSIFSKAPIDFSFLSAATLDLDVRLSRLEFNQTSFTNVHTKVRLHDGELLVAPFDASLNHGGVRGHARLQRGDSGATIAARLIVINVSPADLGRPNAGLIDGGATDLLIDVQSRGGSEQALASHLNGSIALEVRHATIRNSLFDRIGSDVLLQLVSLVNPFAKHDDTTDLHCAAAHFAANDGVLSSPNEIVIETSKMKIHGGGQINLGDETLNIELVPTPREGIGISASDLAHFVRLGGTLGHPHPVADPTGILKTGATIGGAIATGGLSLLGQGLFQRLRRAGTDCGKIFEQNADVPKELSARESHAKAERNTP